MKNSKNRISSSYKKVRCLFSRSPKRLLFEHIPKTAGTAVVRFLTSHYSHKEIFGIDGKYGSSCIRRFGEMPQAERFKFQLIYGHGANKLVEAVHPDTVCTTILRDPVDRLLSLYYFIKGQPTHYLYDLVSSLDLAGFIESDLPVVQNDMVQRYAGVSLENMKKMKDGDVLTKAKKVLSSRYSVVGTMEDLQSWAFGLSKAVGTRPIFPARKVNSTKKRKAICEVDPSVLERCRFINNLDLELYHYVVAMNNVE